MSLSKEIPKHNANDGDQLDEDVDGRTSDVFEWISDLVSNQRV